MKTNENACPRCGCNHVKKNGTTSQSQQRYRCKECGRQFLHVQSYRYRACVYLLRELIVPMTLNGSGIRDTARVLKISSNTVLKVLRESAEPTPEPTPEPTLPMHIQDLEIDEQWSFVQRKKQQNWLWYALNRHSGEIVAFVLGRRTDASCKKLIQKLTLCQVKNFYTDHWKSYPKYLDETRHHIGKEGTQNIERKNLNFRTHLKRLQRRTICFSKSKQMHYNILKIYIHALNSNQHHF